MRQIIVHENGGPDQLTLQDMPSPRPGSGQVLVDVEAAGVNYIDIYQRKGGGLHHLPLPLCLGLEGVGRVREWGSSVVAKQAPAVGSRVAWIDVPGSYADQVVVPAARLIPVPDAISSDRALLFQALTAQYLATEYRPIKPGDRVLVHAAAGGVGHLLVQWFRHLGAFVIGTASNDEKVAAIRANGADAAINYGRDYDFADAVMACTNGQGVDLATDSIGAATFASSLKVLARGGTLVSCGRASGAPPVVDPGELSGRSLRVAGGNVFAYTEDAGELRTRAAQVLEGFAAGWLVPGNSTAFDLADAANAHRALEGRATTGKLYLRP